MAEDHLLFGFVKLFGVKQQQLATELNRIGWVDTTLDWVRKYAAAIGGNHE